ncbi:hypothetical protein CCACVL1_05886 [Corchorus capsularis]|uniref:Uncharacterized protein n=1 Tax=Corchorus capsularis TaxID=210143 RepID=A0A1R3JIN8_COCAP|nr:hypothetical protein CCACVL1_05886 [Corchorus capsularis]
MASEQIAHSFAANSRFQLFSRREY